MSPQRRYILLPFLIILITFLFYSVYQEVQQKTIDEFNAQQILIAKQTAKGIEKLFDDYNYEALFLAESNNIINFNELGIEEIKRHQKSHQQTIKAITRVDQSGKIIYTYPFNKEVIGRDISYQTHVAEILKTHKPVISDVFFAVQNYSTIAYHVPVMDGEEFKGTLAILIPFDKIADEYLSTIQLKKFGYAWLISENGVELFCNNKNHIGKSIFENEEYNNTIFKTAEQMVQGKEGTVIYYVKEKNNYLKKLAVFYPIKLVNTHWSICVATPEDEVLEAMTGFRNKLLLIILFLLIVGTIYTYYIFRARIVLKEEKIRKVAENELRKSEEKFRLLTENQTEVILSINSEGELLYISPNIRDFGGYIAEEEIGKTIYQYIADKNEIVFLLEEIQNLLTDHLPRTVEFTYSPKNHLPFPVEISAKPVIIDDKVEKINCVMKNISERKHAEEQLMESEEKFRSIVENSHDGIIMVDDNFKLLYVNNEFCHMLGYAKEELVKTNFNLYLEENSKNEVIQNYKNRQTGLETPNQYIAKIVHKSGKIRTIEISSNVIENQKGQKLTIAQLLDVTEKEQAIQELKDSERKFRELSDLLPQIIFETDKNGNLTFVNKKAFELFGYTHSEFEKGLSAIDMIVPEQKNLAIQNINKAMRGETIEFTEYNALRKDGRSFPILISSTPITRNNELLGLRGIIVDITEIKESEKKLKRSRAQFRSYIDNAPDGILVFNREHNILDVNKATCFDTGYKNYELLTMNFSTLIDDSESKNLNDFFKELENSGKSTKDLIFTKKDGTKRFWSIDAVSLSETEYLGFVKDITERKLLEDQLQQAQKMEAIGQLAGGVAHDFNNILTIINGYSEMLLQSLPESTSQRDDVKQILKAGKRAESLTRQLLAFSRKQILQPKVLDLNQLIHDLDKMLRRLITENIDLIINYDENLSYIKADPGQIEQVIMNLVINSRDAMPRGGKLMISTANFSADQNSTKFYHDLEPGNYVQLEISDTGIGMNSETISKIYDPFFTTKGSGKGTGLGLSMVYGIVKQSDGYIYVKSKKGKGTSFSIFFKQIKQILDIDKAPKIDKNNLNGTETIFIVEDEDLVRNIAVMALEQYGYNVISASSSKQVDDILTSLTIIPELLLTDVIMPEQSGPEIAKRLNRKFEHLKVLYMSGYTNDAIVNQGVLAENTNFIQKPFSPIELLKKIREVLDA